MLKHLRFVIQKINNKAIPCAQDKSFVPKKEIGRKLVYKLQAVFGFFFEMSRVLSDLNRGQVVETF